MTLLTLKLSNNLRTRREFCSINKKGGGGGWVMRDAAAPHILWSKLAEKNTSQNDEHPLLIDKEQGRRQPRTRSST